MTLLSASQTGNARKIAEHLRDDLYSAHINVKIINAHDYQCKNINRERLLVIIDSTQGDGDY